MLAEKKLARHQHIDIKIVEQQIKQQNGDFETKPTHLLGFVEDCIRVCVRNLSGTSSGFGDRNQTRSHNLNQDKDVILEKGNITFIDMKIDRILEILLSWSYEN